MVSSEDASIQKTWENLQVLVIQSEILYLKELTFQPSPQQTSNKFVSFQSPPFHTTKMTFCIHLLDLEVQSDSLASWEHPPDLWIKHLNWVFGEQEVYPLAPCRHVHELQSWEKVRSNHWCRYNKTDILCDIECGIPDNNIARSLHYMLGHQKEKGCKPKCVSVYYKHSPETSPPPQSQVPLQKSTYILSGCYPVAWLYEL